MESTTVSPGRLQALGIAMALSAGTLWGVSGTICQYLYANTDIDGGLLSSIRMPLAGLILFGYALFTQKKQVFAIFRHWKDALLLVAYALFGMLPCQTGYLVSIQYTNVGTATVLQYTAPVLILLIHCICRHRLPRRMELLALALTLAGVFLIATHGNLSTLSISPKGLMWCAIASAGMALNTLLPVRLLEKYPAATVTSWALLIGGVGSWFLFQSWNASATFSVTAVVCIGSIVIVGTVAAFLLYLSALHRIGPVRCGLISSVELVAAAVLGVVVMHAPFTFPDFLGFVAIAIAVVLLNRGGASTSSD